MAVDSKDKGVRGETQVKELLTKLTGHNWQRVPSSGALNPVHQLKGDLYVVSAINHYCVEVKNYEEDHLTSKILTNKSSPFISWWSQACRQADQVGKKPALFFKYNRSKIFLASRKEIPLANYIRIRHEDFGENNIVYVYVAEQVIKDFKWITLA